MKIHEDKKVNVYSGCTQIERKSFYLVGAHIDFKDMTKECTYKIIDKVEASNEDIISTLIMSNIILRRTNIIC
jgi:hypothetical protein